MCAAAKELGRRMTAGGINLWLILVTLSMFQKCLGVVWLSGSWRCGADRYLEGSKWGKRQYTGAHVSIHGDFHASFVSSCTCILHQRYPSGMLTPNNLRDVRVPEIHMVVRYLVSLTTFRSEYFKIIMADNCLHNFWLVICPHNSRHINKASWSFQ